MVENLPPAINVEETLVTVSQGATATNIGTLSDPGGDPVSLMASIGTVTDLGGGMWDWTYTTSSGPSDSQVVTITATDNETASSFVTFDLVVENLAPTINVQEAVVTVGEGATATNTGTYGDPGGDPVSLMASIGTVTDLGGGMWDWTYTTSSGPSDSQVVTITATDNETASSFVTFDLVVENLADHQRTGSGRHGG